jgi:hypothetical protein
MDKKIHKNTFTALQPDHWIKVHKAKDAQSRKKDSQEAINPLHVLQLFKNDNNNK